MDSSDIQAGISFTYTSIVVPIAGVLTEVFKEMVSAETPSGHEPEYDADGKIIGYNYRPNYNSKITIKPYGTSFYDLRVEFYGESEIENRIDIYRFNGKKYSTKNVFQ